MSKLILHFKNRYGVVLGIILIFSHCSKTVTHSNMFNVTQWDCLNDRTTYCLPAPLNFSFASELFDCLTINFQNLSDDCKVYVNKTTIENIPLVADQFLIDFFGDDPNQVEGLYVRGSTAKNSIFTKFDINGSTFAQNPIYVFQMECNPTCPWVIVNSQFDMLFENNILSNMSNFPPDFGWIDNSNNEEAKFIILFQEEGCGEFINFDVSSPRKINFTQTYKPSTQIPIDDNLLKLKWEFFKQSLLSYDRYINITTQSNIFIDESQILSNSSCVARLETTTMCVGTRTEENIGSIYCGSEENGAFRYLWYIGNTSDDDYQIFSSSDYNKTVLSLPFETFDNCDNTSLWQLTTGLASILPYNYLTPLGNINNFGGYFISRDNNLTKCNSNDQEISLQCCASDCNTIKNSCYTDYQNIGDTISFSDCDFVIDSYDNACRHGRNAFLLSQSVAKCSFRYYDLLHECCQQAVDIDIIALPQYTCHIVESYFIPLNDFAKNLETVCMRTQRCRYNITTNSCNEEPVGIFDECSRLISGEAGTGEFSDPKADCSLSKLNITIDMIRRGEQEDFCNCMEDAVATLFQNTRNKIRKSGSDLCQNTFDAEKDLLCPRCLYRVDSFWDFNQSRYDYIMCTDEEISNITGQICGDIYNDTKLLGNSTQLECLQDNVDLLSEGCCKMAIEQINRNSTIYTMECEGDAQFYCGISATKSIMLSYEGNSTCFDFLISQDILGNLSAKCSSAIPFIERITTTTTFLPNCLMPTSNPTRVPSNPTIVITNITPTKLFQSKTMPSKETISNNDDSSASSYIIPISVVVGILVVLLLLIYWKKSNTVYRYVDIANTN